MNYSKNKKNERGQVMILMTLLVLAGSMALAGALLALAQSQVRTITELSLSKNAYLLAEGALEEVVFRHKKGLQVSATETLTVGNSTVVTTTSNYPGGKIVLSVGEENGRVRKIQSELMEGDGVSFSFGVQTDNGGIIMRNNSSINGNVFSNGPIIGHNLNRVNGSAISAGPSGLITEIRATGTAYAHTIHDSHILGNAHYTSIDLATVVDGTRFPGAPILSTTSLPISDALIDSWAEFASSSAVFEAQCTAAGGTIVYDEDVTLGPAKIPCNVTFEKHPTVTIAGVLWIVGNLEFKQGPKFTIHPDIGNRSVPIIVDNPNNRLTSGTVSMRNSGTWTGNGNRSYLLVISRNESASKGGGVSAITIEQSSGGSLLVYANHGEIELQNNTALTEITAYRVRLRNNTKVNYDSGLASAIFTTGPGGSYTIDTWQEVD